MKNKVWCLWCGLMAQGVGGWFSWKRCTCTGSYCRMFTNCFVVAVGHVYWFLLQHDYAYCQLLAMWHVYWFFCSMNVYCVLGHLWLCIVTQVLSPVPFARVWATPACQRPASAVEEAAPAVALDGEDTVAASSQDLPEAPVEAVEKPKPRPKSGQKTVLKKPAATAKPTSGDPEPKRKPGLAQQTAQRRRVRTWWAKGETTPKLERTSFLKR